MPGAPEHLKFEWLIFDVYIFFACQFTLPGGRHAIHHATLLQKAGAGRVLRTVAAAATAPLQAKVFARIVLRNLEQCPTEPHQLSL
jgi:hypothetical protein